MGWSYTGDPSQSEKDQVRFLIGDTNFQDQLIQDEEINFLINENGDPKLAAAKAAETIAAKFARFVDETVGRVSVKFSQRREHFLELADTLLRSFNESGALPFAGGISISNKDTSELDQDRVRPVFRKDLHENPRNPDSFEDEDVSEFFRDHF